MSYVIGSFNLLKMSYQSDNKIAKDFRQVANIINLENFDVVALQEVMSESVLKRLLMPALGTNKWDYVWNTPRARYSLTGEGYAYIWRKRRFRLVEANDNPRVLNEYKGKLVRPPLIARFTPSGLPGGSNFELRLINTHIIWSKHAGMKTELTDEELRREELRVLSKEIYRLISTKGYGNSLPAYTILMGDYNLCLAGKGPKIDTIIPITERRFLKNVQIEKTTLKQPKSSVENVEEKELDGDAMLDENTTDYYSRNYDHFSYDIDLLDKMKLIDSRVEALGSYYKNDLEAFRKEISDHVPIKLTIDLKTR